MFDREASDASSMRVVASTTFVAPQLPAQVLNLALRAAGLTISPLGAAQPVAVAVAFRNGHADAAGGGTRCAPRSSRSHLVADEGQTHFRASSADQRAGDRPDEGDAADALTVPARWLVWCLAAGWMALRMCAWALLRALRAWDAVSAAIGFAAGRAGRAALAALGPLGERLRRTFAPLGRAVLQLREIASRPLGPFAARLAARVAAAGAWIGRHVAAALAPARPLLDRVIATSRRLTRAVAAAARPITARAARGTAAIRQAAKRLRRAVGDKLRRPEIAAHIRRPE
jgi:hypothetical protein